MGALPLLRGAALTHLTHVLVYSVMHHVYIDCCCACMSVWVPDHRAGGRLLLPLFSRGTPVACILVCTDALT